MTLEFSMTLPDAMFHELNEAARECKCSPTQFVAESLESVLAERRLPRVRPGTHGAWTSGFTKQREKPEAEVEEAEPEGYPVRLEQIL